MRTLILTEGGRDMGFGHIARCLALAQGIKEYRGFCCGARADEISFLINGDDSAKTFLRNDGFSAQTRDWVEEQKKIIPIVEKSDLVIIDSYLAPKSLYDNISRIIYSKGNSCNLIINPLIMMDDYKRIDYPKGTVVNGTIYAQDLNYKKIPGSTYLLGTRYFPLRKQFWNVPKKKVKEKIETMVITFGGYNSSALCERIFKKLIKSFPKVTKKIITGGTFKNIARLEGLNDEKTEFIYSPNAEEIKNIMMKSDIGISAGGQTIYELARIGVPSVVICFVQSQLQNVREWRKRGFLEYAGWHSEKNILENLIKSIAYLEDPDIRRFKTKIGEKLVCGKGSLRIVETIFNR